MNNFMSPLEELEKSLQSLLKTSMGRRAFLQSLPLLVTACASPEKTRYREGDNSGQSAELTIEEEVKMTQEVLPQMKKDYPKLNNPNMQNYISTLGNKLITANHLSGNPYNYNFTVVDVGYVNAFALPAGTVFVTTPLIAMADTEAELMGVIGHEVGHIKARHSAERMFAAKKAQSKSWIYGLGGGLAGAALGLGLGKLACSKNDKKCLQKATEMGALAGVGGGLLIQKYGFMANSREDEMEADRIGFKTALNTGYDKNKIGLFYDKLYAMEQKAKSSKGSIPFVESLSDAMSTHPPSAQRVEQMKQMAKEAQNPSQVITSSNDFVQFKKMAIEYTAKYKKNS